MSLTLPDERPDPRPDVPADPPPPDVSVRSVLLHGHEIAYRAAGAGGPVVVLLHGIAGSSATWEHVLPRLARHATVIAPDLLGHGLSDKPRNADYSLGGHAGGVRDLLVALGHERATLVGHSLGGGIALQLAYQHPERCERLALVGSGGLGRDVHALLRAAALPGAEWVLPFLCASQVCAAGNAVGRVLGRLGLGARTDAAEMWTCYTSLADADARQAFLRTLRSVVDVGGQRLDATDRLYLAAHLPTLLVWGERDPIIPASHAHTAQGLLPSSRLEFFQGAGHFPHRHDPERFAEVVTDFLSTEAAHLTSAGWRALLTGEG